MEPTRQEKVPARCRLVMLGIDAISLSFVRAHLDALPTLARLVQSHPLIETDSPARIVPASVWPSFAAGCGPGDHGQYFPFQWIQQEMRFDRIERAHNNEPYDYEPFWYPIARRGHAVLVLDVGHVFHHAESPCTEILNWSYQSSAHTTSTAPDLLRELRARFGHRPIGPEVPVPKKRALAERLKRRWLASLEKKFDAIRWLLQTQDWDLFIAGLYEIHRAGHSLWPEKVTFGSDAAPDALLEVYQALDRRIDRLLASLDLDTTGVVFFSLHGMAPNRAQDHFMDEILDRLNTRYRGGAPDWAAEAKSKNLMAFLRRHIPYGWQYLAVRLLGDRVQDWVVNRQFTGHRQWRDTLSFACASGGEGYIRLNLKGRERDGCLDPGDRDRYVQWLNERLLQIEVRPGGERLIKEILPIEDCFSGPRTELLPDLVALWQPDAPVEEIHSPDIGTIRARLTTGRGGNHTPESFGLFCGTFPDGFEPAAIRSVTDYAKMVKSLFSAERTPNVKTN